MGKRPPIYPDRIIIDPATARGRPTIRDTRIPVDRVLERLASNPDPRELLAEYPQLSMDDVKAALAYARAILADSRNYQAAREQRFRRMLAVAQRNPDADGDALLEELEREDAERRTQNRPQ
jgi:uncharacterized protein (DUF433 family)